MELNGVLIKHGNHAYYTGSNLHLLFLLLFNKIDSGMFISFEAHRLALLSFVIFHYDELISQD